MRPAILLFAGVVFASSAMSAVNDSFAEERYRVKYGRYTPAREQKPVTVVNYGEPASCCLSLPRHAVKASVLDERFRAKYGRYSPTEERRLKTNGEEVAMHHSRCIGLGRCA
jgi:hypothetical protein